MITFIEHEDYYKHKMPNILENPKRLRVIMKALKENNIFERPEVQKISPESVGEEVVKTFAYDEVGFVLAHVYKSQVLPELYARIIKTVDSRFAVVVHTGVGI